MPGFAYKEYVICGAPVDCYHHAVHLPECSFGLRPTQHLRRRIPRDAVLWSAVTRTAKELTVPYRSADPATGQVLKTGEPYDTGSRDSKRVLALSFGPLAGGAEGFGIAVAMTIRLPGY
jgi:hypothetical protein